jgi:RNA polymerase sigma-70 factor (ECF subfamily)
MMRDYEIRRGGEYTLARKASQGDRLAFDELVAAHDQSILRLALHLCDSTDNVLELYEQVFLNAHKRITAFRAGSSFRLWLYRILSRLVANYRTKNTRNQTAWLSATGSSKRTEIATGDPGEKTDHSGREPGQGAEADCIRLALHNLDPGESIVFELKHYAGLRLRTIAEILQVSETNVTATFCRATRKLRQALSISEGARSKMRASVAVREWQGKIHEKCLAANYAPLKRE